jgi:hypothetical protein
MPDNSIEQFGKRSLLTSKSLIKTLSTNTIQLYNIDVSDPADPVTVNNVRQMDLIKGHVGAFNQYGHCTGVVSGPGFEKPELYSNGIQLETGWYCDDKYCPDDGGDMGWVSKLNSS